MLAPIVGRYVSSTHTWRKSNCTDNLDAATFNCQVQKSELLSLRRRTPHHWGLQMDIAADLSLFRAERDALAFLGLLSSLYLRFDPPISWGDGDTAQPTHFQGLNIHALIIDIAVVEVLSLDHIKILDQQIPFEQVEHRALRNASY